MTLVGSREPTDVHLVGRLSTNDLLWVANTRHGPGGHWFARPIHDDGDHDHLASPEDAVHYLSTHGVPVPDGLPNAAVLAKLAAVREMVRGLADPAGGWTPPVSAVLAEARYVVGPTGTLEAVAGGWDGFVDDLVPPLVDVVASRDRLRACGNPMCRLMFLDASRNRTRQWCDTAGCGNRFRVRRHRRATSRTAAAR